MSVADQSERRLSALPVEDDPAIAELVRMGLRYEGFDVYACSDGGEAVRLADRHRPDVVVLAIISGERFASRTWS